MAKGRVLGVSAVLIILICLVVTFIVTDQAKVHYNRERLIFTIDDPKGDEHGPGYYKYPFDSIFDPKSGHFDLQQFSFSTSRNTYYFDMKFPLVTNPWGASEGFSHTIVQVYVSDSTDNGRIEPFKEGSNVLFDLNNPWKYLIKVVSFNKTAVFWSSDYQGAEGRNKGVKAQLRPDKKTIRVAVPKNLLPGDPYKWKFYVLVGSQDGVGPDNFRPVRAQVGQWNFGGGTDTSYSPNVIDLLAPPEKQEKMLGSYNVSQHLQAVVEPVGPAEEPPSLWEEFLDHVITVMQKMKIKI